jgi:hypothetical protein
MKGNQILCDNVERSIHDPDYPSSDLEVSTTMVAPEMDSDDKKVGIWRCICQ